jgi:septal ring factor EnvC (AmiA/AmiB activator)|tara:strand:+ start:1185 stop:2393 length:1209 start_codon:yes stop_codon:yes gene_type:complete
MIRCNSLFIVCFLFVGLLTQAQETRQQLETKRKEIQAEKDKINSLLSQAISEEKSYLSYLNEINLKINVQQKLMNAIRAESDAYRTEVRANQKKIRNLEAELKKLKDDYGNMIYKSYKSKSQQSRMMFLLSSEDFYQAYKRLQYMKQYTDFRKNQGEQIGVKAAQLNVFNDSLKIKVKEQEVLEVISKKEQNKLNEEKALQQDIISKIKKKERKYKNEIKKKQREQQKINHKIEKIIRDEIARSNKKAGIKSSKFALTAETKLLATQFAGNKGEFPWPVDRGFVSRGFGRQKHPTLSGIYVESNGVRVTTEKGSNARTIFDGTVLLIQVTPGNKKAVFVQHGNYISVYSNLESLSVKTGDKVSTKQILGRIFTDKLTNKTILPFKLYKDSTPLNPTSWIYKM